MIPRQDFDQRRLDSEALRFRVELMGIAFVIVCVVIGVLVLP